MMHGTTNIKFNSVKLQVWKFQRNLLQSTQHHLRDYRVLNFCFVTFDVSTTRL